MNKLGATLLALHGIIVVQTIQASAADISSHVYTIISNGTTSIMGEGEYTDETGVAPECRVVMVKGKKLIIYIINKPSFLSEGDDELGDMLPEDENTEVFDIPKATLDMILHSPVCKDGQRIPVEINADGHQVPVS